MSPWEIGGLTLFILVLLFGTFSILFGFPGTVIIFIDAFLYAAVTGFERIGFKILIALLTLSALAEVTDFAVGMAGAVKFGASRKGLWAFLAGGLIGALLLTPFLLGLGLDRRDLHRGLHRHADVGTARPEKTQTDVPGDIGDHPGPFGGDLREGLHRADHGDYHVNQYLFVRKNA